MNRSPSQHSDEPQDENLGLDLVSQVAQSSRAERRVRPKRWIFALIGLIIVVVLALVTFSLLNGGTKATKATKASDVVSQTVDLRSGGQAKISTSKQENSLGVELSSLPGLDASEQYVVWAILEEGGISVVTKTTGEDAKGGLSPIDDVVAIHITVEGSEVPASPSEETEASVDLPLNQTEQPAE